MLCCIPPPHTHLPLCNLVVEACKVSHICLLCTRRDFFFRYSCLVSTNQKSELRLRVASHPSWLEINRQLFSIHLTTDLLLYSFVSASTSHTPVSLVTFSWATLKCSQVQLHLFRVPPQGRITTGIRTRSLIQVNELWFHCTILLNIWKPSCSPGPSGWWWGALKTIWVLSTCICDLVRSVVTAAGDLGATQ